MVVGFTGTRKGMTKAQKRVVRDLLEGLSPVRAVHGDCTGADADFHALVREVLPECVIVLRPGMNNAGVSPTRAHCDGDVVCATDFYLVRNKRIVKDCYALIACPGGMKEEMRSGTWSTIRHARKMNKYHYVINPVGDLI